MTRILIVDDEKPYRVYLSKSLMRDGYDVATSATGRQAVDFAAEFHPDLLVVDWMLRNEVSGIRIFELLRESMPGLKALLITGFPSRELEQQVKEASIEAILEKPFSLRELRDQVRLAVGAAEDHQRPGRLLQGPSSGVRGGNAVKTLVRG